MTDATFEDGTEKPLRLVAFEAGDLEVLSSLAQDAVFPGNEMSWRAKDRRFAILLNRFRWEDAVSTNSGARPYERVQSLLTIEQAHGVRSQGVTRDADTVLSLLSLSIEPDEDAAGEVVLTLAGDGVLAIRVEA